MTGARDVEAAIARGQVAAAALERYRRELEAAMDGVLAIAGAQGLKALVAGVELRVLMKRAGHG